MTITFKERNEIIKTIKQYVKDVGELPKEKNVDDYGKVKKIIEMFEYFTTNKIIEFICLDECVKFKTAVYNKCVDLCNNNNFIDPILNTLMIKIINKYKKRIKIGPLRRSMRIVNKNKK